MALGWLAMLFFPLLYPQADGVPFLLLWLGMAGLLVVHRIRGWWLRAFRGYWVPSQYSGGSWIPGDEWKAKGTWEVFGAVLLEGALCLWNPIVGTWLIAAGVCQGFAVGLARDEEKAILRAARDARFRARYEMDPLRRELGEQ